MDKGLVTYVKLNALLNQPILIDATIGSVICPKLSSFNGTIILYNNNVHRFIELYDENTFNFFEILKNDGESIRDFAVFALNFFNADTVKLQDSSIFYVKKINGIDNVVSRLYKDNIKLFIDILKVIHWQDDYLDGFVPKNKLEAEMYEKVKKGRKAVKEKASQKDGIGLLEIISSICARHPSLNLINIQELNYYQIIDQFHRLGLIDSWDVNMNALTSGNLSDDGKKQIKHYTAKTDD